MKRKLLLLLLIMLLTGCQAGYNLKLNLNGSVKEDFDISVSKVVLKYDGMGTTPLEFVNNFTAIINKKSRSSEYYVSKNIDDYNMGFKVNKNHVDWQRYLRDSAFKSYLFDDIKVTTDNNLVTIESVGNFKEVAVNCKWCGYPKLEKSYIAIRLPYEVVDSNADNIDSKKNIYYWNFSYNQFPNSIKIEYNKAKLYSYNLIDLLPFINYYILVLVLVIIIVAIVSWYLYIKRIRNNEI